MIFHFHKTKVSVNLFIVLKISLASHVTLLVIVIITCIHERKSPFASDRRRCFADPAFLVRNCYDFSHDVTYFHMSMYYLASILSKKD